jgi:hypothetical protein
MTSNATPIHASRLRDASIASMPNLIARRSSKSSATSSVYRDQEP